MSLPLPAIVTTGGAAVLGQQLVEDVIDGDHPDEAIVLVGDRHRHQIVRGQQLRDLGQSRVRRQRLDFGDRKSTRLNSSHVSISYAVFCLKKKKKKHKASNT